jgi:hypothetical protein
MLVLSSFSIQAAAIEFLPSEKPPMSATLSFSSAKLAIALCILPLSAGSMGTPPKLLAVERFLAFVEVSPHEFVVR